MKGQQAISREWTVESARTRFDITGANSGDRRSAKVYEGMEEHTLPAVVAAES